MTSCHATFRTMTTRFLPPKRRNSVTSTRSLAALCRAAAALLLRTGRRDAFCESEKRNVHHLGKLTLKRGLGRREANIPPSFSVITNLCVANCEANTPLGILHMGRRTVQKRKLHRGELLNTEVCCVAAQHV